MIEVRYIYDVEDKPINEYTINNGKYHLSVINLGAALTKIIVPNQKEKLENITLRYHDYKEYKKNPLLLGALVNFEKFKISEECLINVYFNCIIENNQLIFSYVNHEKYITVIYTLEDNAICIEYDNNLGIKLSQLIFFNLSGNNKSNILNHRLFNNSQLFELQDGVKFQNTNLKLLSIGDEENGISINISGNNQDIYLSKGEYFKGDFLVNKKSPALPYSGIGTIVSGVLEKHHVNYEFTIL